jgi:hypothetical protein
VEKFVSFAKEWLAGAYRENHCLTICCIYVVFTCLAVFTHLYIKGLSKQETTQSPQTTQPIVIQNPSNDNVCSNIVAGRDASVNCSTSEKKDDKAKNPDKH